jgi:hypothetical protein
MGNFAPCIVRQFKERQQPFVGGIREIELPKLRAGLEKAFPLTLRPLSAYQSQN